MGASEGRRLGWGEHPNEDLFFFLFLGGGASECSNKNHDFQKKKNNTIFENFGAIFFKNRFCSTITQKWVEKGFFCTTFDTLKFWFFEKYVLVKLRLIPDITNLSWNGCSLEIKICKIFWSKYLLITTHHWNLMFSKIAKIGIKKSVGVP